MGGLGGADGQPGHHSLNIGGSVSSKRTITEANGNRCLRLLVLLFRTRNYVARAYSPECVEDEFSEVRIQHPA